MMRTGELAPISYDDLVGERWCETEEEIARLILRVDETLRELALLWYHMEDDVDAIYIDIGGEG
jgi:hypothetical protein